MIRLVIPIATEGFVRSEQTLLLVQRKVSAQKGLWIYPKTVDTELSRKIERFVILRS